MSVEVKRKGNESNESLLRRFQDKIKRSRVLKLAKQKNYHSKPKNKNAQKEEAKRRSKNRTRREYLIKMGKLPENNQQTRGYKK